LVEFVKKYIRDEMKEEHKNSRKMSRLVTRERRKGQTCRVYELKIDQSHLSKEKKSYLNRIFLEAKWFYNSLVGCEDIFKFDDKVRVVSVLNKDKEREERSIECLSAQMRQAIKERSIGSIKALTTVKKEKKNRAGKLKFKSKINSVPLRQLGHTYKFSGTKYVLFQGFKKAFKIIGYEQIPKDAEFANSVLIRKASGYYLKVTCFLLKEEKTFEEPCIGIDFGIKTSLTLSNGEKFDINYPVNDRTKRLQSQGKRKKKGSSNRYRHQRGINKSIERTTNKKKDKRNKIVSYITNKFETVIVQDENIKAWHAGRFGKKVQSSSIGGIMRDLKKKSHTLIEVDRFFPSTKMCPECGTLNKISLSERIYICDCGYIKDRDTHSALNILREGLKQIGREPINTMPVEGLLDSDDRRNSSKRAYPSEAGSPRLQPCGSSQHTNN
jgi:putative transposase